MVAMAAMVMVNITINPKRNQKVKISNTYIIINGITAIVNKKEETSHVKHKNCHLVAGCFYNR